ncbi:class I SAM-dependent methyltransferase [Fictibacillus aquaticus]|uniref:Methyltransferase type 11 domain-containing protein n=1 Tax=Fictibacillus aquaticus TaxID=2021314 RepID=A0A235F6A6_9BACL|nr:class I SAM-dependent methyltransferase [Fictibacillus aquaticus]OYD56749.1 hypothetical protein CGZ90_17220 [Fictibacillus aquaticus]
MVLLKPLKKWVDLQYQSPSGILGLYFGEKMVLQHQPETLWTIELLKLRHEERVLEIGCGAGYAIKKVLLHPHVQFVAGLDISTSVLRSAKLRNRQSLRKGTAEVLLGNVSDIPLDNESFTKVFSIHSLYFWDVSSQTVSELYRVLKPNGTVTLTICNGKDGETWTGVQSMVEELLIPLMIQTGFKDVKIVKGPSSRGYHTIAVGGGK